MGSLSVVEPTSGERLSGTHRGSSAAVRSSPQIRLAVAICAISRRRFAGMRGRPGPFDFHRQNNRKPFSMPAHQRVRLDDHQQLTPVDQSRQRDQRDAGRVVGAAWLHLALDILPTAFVGTSSPPPAACVSAASGIRGVRYRRARRRRCGGRREDRIGSCFESVRDQRRPHRSPAIRRSRSTKSKEIAAITAFLLPFDTGDT
jgi:hypothetical protein